MKKIIHTKNAPAAIGTYSQAVKCDKTVYISGQIPFQPETMTFVDGDIKVKIQQVIHNLKAVCEAAGGSLNHIVKLTVYLIDMQHAPIVNQVMTEYFSEPFPARATIGVAALPKGAEVEMDAIMVLES